MLQPQRLLNKRLIVLLCSLIVLSPVSGYTQEVVSTQPQVSWHIRKSDNVVGNYYSPSAFRRSIINLTDGSVVAAAQFDDNQSGAIKMTSDGKTLWEMKVAGLAMGIGKIGDNFILFYSDEDKYQTKMTLYGPGAVGVSTILHGVLLNGKTGKVLQDKVIYDNDKKAYIDSRSLNRADGTFSNLLIRVSDFNKGTLNYGKEIEQRLTSKKILLVDIDGSLNIKTKELKSVGQEGFFIGAELGGNDDLFFSTIVDDQLTVERFNKEGQVIAKLATPLEVRTVWNPIRPVTIVNPDNSGDIIIGLGYTKKNKDLFHQMFEFNFSTKKVASSGEQELDKDYRKSWDITQNGDFAGGDLKEPGALRIMNIIITKEKFAVVKQMHFVSSNSNTGSTRYESSTIVVDIFDHNWKLMKSLAIDRGMGTFVDVASSVGTKAYGEILYIIAPAIKGAGKYTSVFAKINLNTQHVDAYTDLTRESLKKQNIVEGDATIWQPDGMLVENLIQVDGFLAAKKDDYRAIWQKIKF
jgi:hypothetical protein